MTRVLVPTDFSENAWNAIQYGVRLYQNTPCVFYLLHVHISKRQENSGDTFANGMLFELPQRVSRKKKLEELKESLEGCFENPNHRFESLQVNGLFVDGIRRAIAEHQIDLIVMGTKGASGLKEATIGSRTGEVITR
ncbi:MAG: universal stress protein, partial [Bacteroidota bacterium]